MIDIVRLLLRFAWLALFILGVRKALELAQGGIEEAARRVEEGDTSSVSRSLVDVHDALHRRQGQRGDTADTFGEM